MTDLWSPILDLLCEVSDKLKVLEKRIWEGIKKGSLTEDKVGSFKLRLEILSSKAAMLEGVERLRLDSRIHNINREMDAYLQRLTTTDSPESPDAVDEWVN